MIAGIHTGVVSLRDGSLLALGRGDNLSNPDSVGSRMPMSISKDGGKTWTYSASEFPPIAGGQRLVLRRLNEGPLLLVSFTNHPYAVNEEIDKGMMFTDTSGKSYKGYGLYAALSFDDGQTWPVKKLLTDGKSRFLDGGAWTGFFEMDATHAEPRGYLAATQTPDNVIHLISSHQHYRFTLPWLQKKPWFLTRRNRPIMTSSHETALSSGTFRPIPRSNCPARCHTQSKFDLALPSAVGVALRDAGRGRKVYR